MPNLFSLLLDWLVTHLVALAFLVFLVVAIVARGPLFGMFEAAADQVVVPAPPQPESSENMQGNAPVQLLEQEAAVAAEPEQQKTESSEQEQPAAQDVAKISAQDTVFRPTEPDASDHSQFVPLAVVNEAKLADKGNNTGLENPAELPPIAPEPGSLLQDAREAFWKGSLEHAERLYLKYLSLRPADANSFGELGNLYQSMGRPGDALDAYFEAGVRFKSQGDSEQLAQILELLAETGDPRAELLRNQ